MTRSPRILTPIVVVLVALLAWVTGTQAMPAAPSAAARPNVVFVLTDDLSWNLIAHMPQVRRLQADGVTFNDYTVTDSLCCPSRSSIFTGRFPHDTGVFTNGGADGGFGYFHGHGEEKQTFATALQSSGYRTAMMGKYLNGYLPADTQGGTQPYVPPGWSEWDVGGNGYQEFDYDLNENHKVVHYGNRPQDYMVDVLAGKGANFIADSAAAHQPFLLEIATFAPHAPYTPAPRDADSFPGLTAPRGPAFDTLPADAPPWLAGRAPLTGAEKTAIDSGFRKRVQAVQSVDRMLTTLRAAVTKAGVAGDTYVVFSSDNGYHMGQYRLNPGKMTAFDTDIRVPLVVAGPGVTPGSTSTAQVQNIDLAPTFQSLAGTAVPSTVDGRSLAPLLHGGSGAGWRTTSLVEHHGPDALPDDPDLPAPNSGNPPTYSAIRTGVYTYVEYSDGSREYYDRTTDPHQLHNLAGTLSPARLAELHAAVTGLTNCHTGAACWTAGHAG
ncbi:Arylsulfatase A [Amycolatopsis xylanica]|uniref:Arylsulfatase A n=1 Tax=Amycolatopsis xylanica TaxID=589385 RepID=A0A1H2WGC8_9PSEU|nr:sulfatase [Amycolatopsis xylanica]SDW79546.1 Arylsulfatase A [Amycolatopsis xylanica]